MNEEQEHIQNLAIELTRLLSVYLAEATSIVPQVPSGCGVGSRVLNMSQVYDPVARSLTITGTVALTITNNRSNSK